VSQSGAKQFFSTKYITLNSSCEAQRGAKNLKKCGRELEAKNMVQVF
jgi:hypothetical protein